MNTDYLIQYISKRLHTCVQYYDSSDILRDSVCFRPDLIQILDEYSSVIASFLLSNKNISCPQIYIGDNHVCYSVISNMSHTFIIGPLLLPEHSDSNFTLSGVNVEHPSIDYIYTCNTDELCDILLLGYNLFSMSVLSFDDICSFNFSNAFSERAVLENYSNIIFENIEKNSRHNPYDQEVREITSIRNGNIKQLEQSWQEDYIGTAGTVGKNLLRNNQNIAIILVTLASRAAMEAGLHPEIGYSLSDSYILKIEEVTDPFEAIHLGRKAEYHYTQLVHELKTKNPVSEISKNHHINRCKDYIFAHLHEKIQVTDIAGHLFLNPNYLANLFKKEEGITLTEYIMKEKIELAKNMLIYSQYSFNSIAAYLGFCSQSHLGKHFKAYTEMTLQEYRTAYGVVEFRS